MLQRSQKRVKSCKSHRKRSTYFSLKLQRERNPWYLTHITTQCFNASEQKYQLRPATAPGLELPVKLSNSSGSCSCPLLQALLQRMQCTGTANCTECRQQSMSATQHTRNSYCKDLCTSPATEDSAGPGQISHLISFKNVIWMEFLRG